MQHLPVQVLPVQVLPVQVLPVQILPVQLLTVQVVPVQLLPVQLLPVQAVHVQVFPVQAVCMAGQDCTTFVIALHDSSTKCMAAPLSCFTVKTAKFFSLKSVSTLFMFVNTLFTHKTCH